jgi:hypothetical protein
VSWNWQKPVHCCFKEFLPPFSSSLLLSPRILSIQRISFPVSSLCSTLQNKQAIRYTSTAFFPLHFTRNGLRGKISQFFKLYTPSP